MFENFGQDLRRCGNSPYQRVREGILSLGMWAVLSYRFRRWLFTTRAPRPIRWVLIIAAELVQLLTNVTTNIELPGSVDIGPGLYIPHTGYIVVALQTVIGRHCTLTQGVTIGHGGGGGKPRDGYPVIGNRVYVGPGSAIIGPVTIGDDALIGVGAVVIHSVPPRGVAVGNPARIISRAGSFDLIDYPGMDDDPDRLASLAEAEAERAGCAAPSR